MKTTSKKKYEKGGKIKTLTEACIRIQERKPFYWRHDAGSSPVGGFIFKLITAKLTGGVAVRWSGLLAELFNK